MNLAWLLALILLLCACSGPAERIWLKAPGWSRARVVANIQVVDPVSMAVDDEGVIYLFLIDGEVDAASLRVIALDREADIIWDRVYQVELKHPDQTRILWTGQAIQLFWLSDQALYTVQVESRTGDMLGQPTLLSGRVKVGSYDVDTRADSQPTVWYAGNQDAPGLYALPPGELAGGAALVDAFGTQPDVQYDETGTLQTLWSRYPPGIDHPQFFYAAYPGGAYGAGRETMIMDLQVGTSRVEGPWLGLDGQYVYLLWTVTPRLGPRAGMAATYYTHFIPGQPAAPAPAGQLFIPYAYRLEYQAPPGKGLETGPRVALGPGSYEATSYISETSINPALAPEVAIAFHTQLPYLRRQEQGQVSALFFRDGAPAGYQLLSFTPASSGYPAIYSDQRGQLYLTWLESGAETGYMVYFASTAPDLVEALSGLTRDDALRLGAEVAFGLLSGVLLVPLALIWVIAPMIVLGLTSVLRRRDEALTSPGVLISLVLAVGLYWVSKFAFMPGMSDYVPFSAWLPTIPSVLQLPLQAGVPVLTAGFALWTAWRYTYAQDRPGAFFFFAIYALVDAVLTMAVYGTLFYGAF
jgi:hypothetical protein